jgi:peptidoglycan/LPS O-acetylase OafA/YrhL
MRATTPPTRFRGVLVLLVFGLGGLLGLYMYVGSGAAASLGLYARPHTRYLTLYGGILMALLAPFGFIGSRKSNRWRAWVLYYIGAWALLWILASLPLSDERRENRLESGHFTFSPRTRPTPVGRDDVRS